MAKAPCLLCDELISVRRYDAHLEECDGRKKSRFEVRDACNETWGTFGGRAEATSFALRQNPPMDVFEIAEAKQ